MILHNVMWESRPLPKIVRRPPCSSQREGVFFVPGISFLCPCRGLDRALTSGFAQHPLVPAAGRLWCPVVQNGRGRPSPAARPPCGQASIWRQPVGTTARHKRSPRSASVVDRPRYQPGIFCWEGMRCWPATHACPGPLCLPLPGRRDIVRCQADWSGRLLVVSQGERYAAKRQADAGRFEAGENLGENVAGRETILEKSSPSPCPTLPKTFAGGPAAAEPVQRWESPQRGRAAAIPQSHVMARQEAEVMAFEGRDIRQGIAGAGQADRIEACHFVCGCKFLFGGCEPFASIWDMF